jgi:tetratricopeptide (TPR) repeat protein
MSELLKSTRSANNEQPCRGGTNFSSALRRLFENNWKQSQADCLRHGVPHNSHLRNISARIISTGPTGTHHCAPLTATWPPSFSGPEIYCRKSFRSGSGNIAMVLGETGDADAALRIHSESLEFASQTKDWYLSGNQLANIGIIFCDFGLYGLATYYLERAKTIQEAHGSHAAAAVSFGEIAIAQMRDGELKAARQNYATALTLGQSSGYESAVGLFGRYRTILGEESGNTQRPPSFPSVEAFRRHASRRSRLKVLLRRTLLCLVLALCGAAASYLISLNPTIAALCLVALAIAAIPGHFLGLWILERRLVRLLFQASKGIVTPLTEQVIAWSGRLFPERHRILLSYATWLDWNDRNRDAIRLLTRYARYVAADFDLSCQLAWALADAGTDLTEAQHWVEHAKQLNPDNPCLYDTEAWIEFRRGNYEIAYEKVQEAIPLADYSPDIAFHAGAIFARTGRPVEALAFLNKALDSPRLFGGRKRAEEIRLGICQLPCNDPAPR